MIQQNHTLTSYSLSDYDTGIDLQPALDALESLMGEIDVSGEQVDILTIVGEQTLLNGGYLGKLLRLIRVHIQDMKQRGELTENESGIAIVTLMQEAMNEAMEFPFKNIQLKQDGKKKSIDAIREMIAIEKLKIDSANSELLRKETEFNLEFILPSNHQVLTEEIIAKHITHEISTYNLDNLLPADLTSKNKDHILQDDKHNENLKNIVLLDDNHDLNTKDLTLKDDKHSESLKGQILQTDAHNKEITELEIRDYYHDNIQPKELIAINDKHDESLKGQILQTDAHNKEVVELEIREYYHDNIQPEEKLTIIAQRIIAQKEALIKEQDLLIRAKELILAGKKIELAEKDIIMREKEIAIKLKELDVMIAEIAIKQKELQIKAYELSTILPAQVAKMTQETCVLTKECAIKDYYHINIQPEEKTLTKAKAFIEQTLAGSFVAADSMPQKKINQMVKQTELYTRQILSYNDKKYQALLDTQVNYAAMIFADTPGVPDILDMGLEDSVMHTKVQILAEPS